MTEALPIPAQGRIGPWTCGRISYGCWRFAGSSVPEARSKIEAAHANGITLIDTAAIYGYGEDGFGVAEERLGAVFADAPALRRATILVTKAGIHPPLPYDSRAETLIQSCEASLRRLETDVIDIFLIHRPDYLAAPQEVAGALTRLRDAGKIREAGVSNHSTHQMRALQAHLDFPLIATQPEFSALHPDPLEDGTLDLAQALGMAVMAWSPLAGGLLVDTAQPRSGTPAARVLPVMTEIAGNNGCGVDHVALAGCASTQIGRAHV